MTPSEVEAIDWTKYGREASGYDRRDYVRDYLLSNKLPDIHDQIGHAIGQMEQVTQTIAAGAEEGAAAAEVGAWLSGS